MCASQSNTGKDFVDRVIREPPYLVDSRGEAPPIITLARPDLHP